MEILHRYGDTATPEVLAELARIGVAPRVLTSTTVALSVVTVDIAESDPRWPAVHEWAMRRRTTDVAWTVFAEEEVAAADWLAIEAEWQHGYPQPAEDDQYHELTYDLSRSCGSCWVGHRQNAPFRMAGEPRWGRHSILQLNWVFDEYFVTPEAWSAVFGPAGVEARPVLNRRGRPLATVVQLVVDQEVDLAVEDLPFTECRNCEIRRYLPVRRGPFPALVGQPLGAMVRSRQWFGAGGTSSWRGVLVSQELRLAIVSAGIRGASFRPAIGALNGSDGR